MTDDMTLLKPRRRLRPGSERELRLLRLAWLSGWSIADMAALLGDSVRTVRRRLARHDLKGPEAPGEQARLIAGAMKDAIAEGLLCGDDPAVKDAVSTLQKMAGATRTLQTAAREQKADEVKVAEDSVDDWRVGIEDEIERLIAEEKAMAAAAAEAAGAPAGEVTAAGMQGALYEIKSSSRGARPDAGILCPAAPPAYTGSAAGAGADVTAFGRTYRTMHSSRGPPG
ncbi:MAG: hypothetical protein ACK4MQ_10405 [Hyphomonas sp.]